VLKTSGRDYDPAVETVAERETSPGSVGWFLDDSYVRDLIRDGIKVRVKTSHSERGGGDHETETTDTTRVILSLPGGLLPGRRLAELTSSIIDVPSLIEVVEALHLTVFGPNRQAFHRERLFDGGVENRADALEKLRELLGGQLGA